LIGNGAENGWDDHQTSADHENMSSLSEESREMGNWEVEDVESENHSKIS
jgi:hypothetical protein